MYRRRARAAVLGVAAVVTVACGGAPPAPPAAGPSSAPAAAAAPTSTPYASAAPSQEQVDFATHLEPFDPTAFSTPTKADNTWFPLTPGTRFVYEGSSQEPAAAPVPHRIVVTVTDLTKVINGTRSILALDQEFSDGELSGAELAFYAQDDGGNIWHLGQYPETYENGELVEARPWIAGVDDARPGIMMKREPDLGGPSYSQGWSPTLPWTDRARVSEVGVQRCVPAGCYDNIIVTQEFNREEPGALQEKHYAPGVGNIRAATAGRVETQENLELVGVTQLDPSGLAEARAEALALEKRAYEQSADVYGTTAPSEQTQPGN